MFILQTDLTSTVHVLYLIQWISCENTVFLNSVKSDPLWFIMIFSTSNERFPSVCWFLFIIWMVKICFDWSDEKSSNWAWERSRCSRLTPSGGNIDYITIPALLFSLAEERTIPRRLLGGRCWAAVKNLEEEGPNSKIIWLWGSVLWWKCLQAKCWPFTENLLPTGRFTL